MYRCGCLSLLLLLFTSSLYSQDTGKLPSYLSAYHKAEKLFHLENSNETTDSIAGKLYLYTANLLTQQNIYNEVLVDCYLKYGILQMTENDNGQALAYLWQAVLCWKKGGHLPDSLLFRPYLYIGSIWYNLNGLDSAAYYYRKAEAISSHYPALAESERLYNKMGALYYETNDYKRCIPYYEKALAVVTARNPPNAFFFIVNYKNNIASALLKMEDYQQALAIYKDLLQYHINSNQLYSNIGSANFQLGNLQEALHYFNLVSESSAEKYNHLTMVFLKTGQYDSAVYYNAKSIAYYARQKKINKDLDYILTTKYTADVQAARGDNATAVKNYQFAIVLLVPGFNETDPAKNPIKFTGLPNFSVLFDVLTAKAKAFSLLSVRQSSQPDLEHALAAYTAALSLARYAERTYSSDEARLFLKNKVNPACGAAVTTALALYNQSKDQKYLSTAFAFVENNKASVLQAGIQQPELLAIAGLPAALIEQEKQYKSVLARLTIQISQVRDSIAQAVLEKKLLETELQLSVLQEKLDENPAYHRLKFDTRETSLAAVQQRLWADKEQALLSYYFTGGQLFCFYSSSVQSGCTVVPLADNFFTAITGLRKSLQTAEAGDRQSINTYSRLLFQLLLQPVISQLKDKKRLVIIPYNEISYVPFELLRGEKDGTLLLNQFSISYQYSANFLTDESNIAKEGYHVLAMAPFTDLQNEGAILPALPSSGAEIAELPGKIITGTAATRTQFITLAGQYPVVHLATHAVANDYDPLGCYIEFYGKKADSNATHRLYEQEIYNLDMKNAKLLILSACETGNGLLVNGEGVVSLSRAFSYAGCKSVITSLWKADDASTAFIMKRLHHYLQKGWAKDRALQQAKLDYIADPATEDRFKTPYYWAHMVLIGNQQAVVSAGIAWYIPVTGTLFLLGIGFLLYKRKRVQ